MQKKTRKINVVKAISCVIAFIIMVVAPVFIINPYSQMGLVEAVESSTYIQSNDILICAWLFATGYISSSILNAKH